MVQNLFKRQKTLNEMEEETERLEVENKNAELEYSITQKREMAKQLKERGLEPKHFGKPAEKSTWQRIYQWLKTH